MQFELLIKRTKEKKIIQQLQTSLNPLHLLLVYQLLQPQSYRPLGQTAAPNTQYLHALSGVLVIAALNPQVLDGFQGLCSSVISLCFWKWEQQVQGFCILSIYRACVTYQWWGGSFALLWTLLCAQIFCITILPHVDKSVSPPFSRANTATRNFTLLFSGWCVFGV